METTIDGGKSWFRYQNGIWQIKKQKLIDEKWEKVEEADVPRDIRLYFVQKGITPPLAAVPATVGQASA